MFHFYRCICIAIVGLLLSGCSNNYSGDQYSSKGVGEISRTDRGVIISMRRVDIKPEEGPGAGALIGAVGGGLAGSMFGKGGGKVLAAGAGAAAGGLAGHMIQNRSQDGMEYTVKLDSGAVITLAQGLTPALSVGQRVFVINSNRDRSRIVPE
ncbi:MAG: glycine zipper 2TM domain-containing protein [Holosporales bacterium]|jgi:outer membrane lipoprotein SlyB|nr:glycine zipper 2TM domain-containing protein [Holosporales bacterium]